MTNGRGSVPPTYFEGLYARDPDPWRFETSDYEAEKYRASLAVLPAGRFASALEVGCSIGVLTRLLADRCEALVAVDFAETALARARQRCADLPHVTFRRMQVPGDWPAGSFDLVVLSEVLYFLSPEDIGRTAARTLDCLRPGGVALLVVFLGETDNPVSGNQAAEIFIQACGGALTRPVHRLGPGWRLDLLVREG